MKTLNIKSKQEKHPVEFHHPICHYLNGERLYYVLLKVKTHVFEIGEKIHKALNEEHLHGSSCGYFLFGASDILLRIWGAEKRIMRFKKRIESFPEISGEPEFMLISSMETWYQREIESDSGWSSGLTSDNFQNLFGNPPPERLKMSAHPDRKTRNPIRFFVFVRDDSGKNKPLMSDLRSRFRSKDEKLFTFKHRISIYSTYSPTFGGLLIKGETVNFPELAPLLVGFAEEQKDQQRFTTTYICSSHIKDEANSLVEPGNDGTPKEPRKSDILHNLLISDSCNQQMIDAVPSRDKAASQFISKLKDKIEHFFDFHVEWWAYTKDFRLLFKWCVMEDNDQLHAYLMRHFAKVEHELRELVWPSFSKDKLRDDRQKFDKLMRETRGRLSVIIGKKGVAGNEQAGELEKICQTIQTVFESQLLNHEIENSETHISTEKEIEEAQEMKRRHLTMGTIAAYLSSIAKRVDEGKTFVVEFAKALHDCSDQRNRIAHGSIQDLTRANHEAELFPWELPVVNFIRMMLYKPRAVVVVKKFVSSQQNQTLDA